MHRHIIAISSVMIVALEVVSVGQGPDELHLAPMAPVPEPVGELRPEVRWMVDQKIRLMWISYNLFDRFGSIEVPAGRGEKTKGAVLAEAGFNVVSISMYVNTDGDPDGTTLDPRTVDPKYDRSLHTDLETRLQPNVAAARRHGLRLLVGLRYGSDHLEPYRKYRGPDGALAKRSCCPLDETYIAGQHIGNWAVRAAELGADGVNIDVEMYQSDLSSYPGPCYCDDCFATYVAAFARQPQRLYDRIAPQDRGRWIRERQGPGSGHIVWGGTHYAAFAARRIEALWDGIRRRCQAINPAFIMAHYHTLQAIPGMARGLGTASVPGPVLSAHEYHTGPYRSSYISMNQRIAGKLPVLFVSGLYVRTQSPERFADSALRSCLYTDGYFAYYGTALLNFPGAGEEKKALPGGYGRHGNSTAADYLDRLQAAHARVDRLLVQPREAWPERVDGKLRWLREKLQAAEARRDEDATDEARQAVEEAASELKRYEALVEMGGY